MKKQLFNLELWYIAHIFLIVGVAVLGGHYLQSYICSMTGVCIETITNKIVGLAAMLFYYSFLVWLVDTLFHGLTGYD